MTAIAGNNTSAGASALLRQAQTTNPATAVTGGAFGEAVNVTLSASGRAAAQGTGASETTPSLSTTASGIGATAPQNASLSSAAAKAPPPLPKTGGPVGITGGASSSAVESLVEEAKQQVIPKVGVTGADLVVDDKGNIDQAKLNQLLAQQQSDAAQKSIVA